MDPFMSGKRKLRDGDDCDKADQPTLVPPPSDGLLPDELGATGRPQRPRVSPSSRKKPSSFVVPGLRFATESWSGLKASNEDRHVASLELFPGPVLGIFDGHGGIFSAEFLTRHLVKNVASSIRQKLGEKALNELQTLQEFSRQEAGRKRAIIAQMKSLSLQTAELSALEASDADVDASYEVTKLQDQLSDTIVQLQNEVKQIEAEEAARQQRRGNWGSVHHFHFQKAFVDAFERTDAQILQKNPSRDGSTALLVCFLADSVAPNDAEDKDDEPSLDGLTFYIVNLGDCRAVLCRGGRAVPLTTDHKPDRPGERQRIEKAGGYVGKIAGISRVYSAAGAGLAMQRESSTYLAVSRAFGDRTLKVPTPLVSCEPEIRQCQVESEDLFLVLACDGIWDVLSDQDAVGIALPLVQDAKAAAAAIVKAAYKKGSADNLTATVVVFDQKAAAQAQRAPTIASSPTTNSSELISTTNEEEGDAREEVQEGADEDEEIDMFKL
ncbi:hypothetical protein BBJ28_00004017 [Nothophytophthora sp. Chile5]|nr:hypothetical protein BBJ28_00004017 [Nothophytophthora sp. Chile5]